MPAKDRQAPPVSVPFPDPPREKPSASAEFVPEDHHLPALRRAAHDCAGCELFRGATQVVFGEGPTHARLMFVGEAPGDQEDRTGRPFVGPAGGLLARVLNAVGIPREQVYVTNAVKHFKFKAQGKRRLHVKPSAGEIQACRAWLLAELDAVRPEMIVCLGATAAQAFAGKKFSVTESHGQVFKNTPWAPWWMATLHPAALLRIPDEEARAAALAGFEADMARAAAALASDHRHHARAS
jgi:uracil-DNA glycosylase family protein